MDTNKQNKLVEDIQSIIADHFRNLGKLPENEDIIKDMALELELRRVLAIPDRLSYLAKGIISQSDYDSAKRKMHEMIVLFSHIDQADVDSDVKSKITDSIVETELDNVMQVLRLRVESDDTGENPPIKNIIKRHTVKESKTLEQDDISVEEDIVDSTVGKLKD